MLLNRHVCLKRACPIGMFGRLKANDVAIDLTCTREHEGNISHNLKEANRLVVLRCAA